MKVHILLIIFFNYIGNIQIPGDYNIYDSLSSYITPENDMLIYNPKNSSLLKYIINSKSPFYTNMSTLNTKEFPKDGSINLSDIHFHFNYINSSSINITYFNENYTSYYIYNPSTENITYKHISLEVKEKNKLILFLHPTNSSYSNPSINIVEFDFKSEEKIKFIKNYTIYSKKEYINCYCVSASSYENNIICGLIEFGFFYNKSSILSYSSRFIYTLIYFSESTPFPKNVTIFNQTFSNIIISNTYIDDKTGIFNDNFIKFIPLSEEKTIFCFDENNDYLIMKYKIKCGLAKVQNNNIIISSLIDISDLYSRDLGEKYLNKNNLGGVKINDKQVILSYHQFKKESYQYYSYKYYTYIYYIKITIINDKLSHESKNVIISSSLNSNSPGFYSLYLLKNNDDDLISITVFKGKASFNEYGYITCQNSSLNLYNGEEYKFNFMFNSLFENYNIIFLDKNNQTIHSIIDQNYKPIKYLETYNKSYIRYKYNPKDYDYIKNNNLKLFFTASLNEKISETCQINLNFYQCNKECNVCTNQNCYDKNMNKVIIYNPTDLERYFFILPLSILAMLIVLIFFSFAKCCVKEPLPNYGGNLIQNEMPLIQS